MTAERRRALRRADGARGARARWSRRCAARAGSRRREPYTHEVPFSHRSGERIEPLISLQWFMRMDELAAPAIDAVRDGRVRIHPERWSARLPRLAGEHPPVVHLAPAVVGPPAPGLVPRRRDLRRRRAPPEGEGWERDPDVLDTWFSSRAVAVRDARLARRDAGAARLLPDRRALDGARHPLPLGRADDHDGARVRRRRPVRRRLRPLGHPGARRAADVQVAGHRDRPARRDRRRTAPTPCASACSRCPRSQDVRYSRREGRSRASSSRTSSGTPRACPAAASTDGARPEPRPRDGRGPLDPLAPAARERGRSRGASTSFDFSHAALGALRLRLRRAVRLVPGAGQAAALRRGDERADVSADAAARAARDARARAPGDPVRDRGDLVASCPAPTGCSPARRFRGADADAASTRRPRRRSSARSTPCRRCAAGATTSGAPAGARDPGAAGGRRATTTTARSTSRGSRASSCDGATADDAGGHGRDPRRRGARAAPATPSTSARPSARRDERARASSRPRSRAPRASSPTRASWPRRRRRVVAGRARQARAPARASSDGRCERRRAGPLERRRALPARARAVRHALRAGPHAPADDRARASPQRALRLDPRRRHERQVLDRAHDRGDPRSATACAPAPTSRRTSSSFAERDPRSTTRDLEPARVRRRRAARGARRGAGRPHARRRTTA